jgi:hypothetical protein
MTLVWKDGTRMIINDGKGPKPFEAMLNDPDIKDMFAMTYPAGDTGLVPDVNFDPGGIRYLPLFIKMYGDCRKANLAADAGEVAWLPKKYGKTIKFSKVNGAASDLQKVSNELDQLPDQFLGYLRPLQGTFNCRTVAGTVRLSSHGTGTAIDLAKAHSDYWLWSKPDALVVASFTRMSFLGRSCVYLRSTALFGVAGGITTTQCIFHTDQRCL